MATFPQSCLAVVVVLAMTGVPLGATHAGSDIPGAQNSATQNSIEPSVSDGALTPEDIEKLQETVTAMMNALNAFDYEQFSHFFAPQSLEMLKHQVQGYSSNHLFELIFPEGKRKANELTSQQFFIRIIAKSKFNVGVSRPYETHTPKFRIRAEKGDIATVLATFPDAYSRSQTRSEWFTFQKVNSQWLSEAPDFILSDFKYDLTQNFASERRFYPLYPLTDTFRIMLRSWHHS